jgi:hypothetical protein
MSGGRRLPAGSEPLVDVRARCLAVLAALPPSLRSHEPVAPEETAASGVAAVVAAGDLVQPGEGWTVRLSDGLRALAAEVRADLADGVADLAGTDAAAAGAGDAGHREAR